MARTTSKRGGKSGDNSFINAVRDRPIAAAAAAAGVAAAGALLWSKRGQIGEAIDSGMDSLNELKAQRFGDDRAQAELSEEALTLKETGKKAKPQTSNQESKAGAKVLS